MNADKLRASARIHSIDELRGLALVLVVLSHAGLVYGLDTDIAYGLAIPAFGVGVDLFFVISGFVIYRNVLTTIAASRGDALKGAQAFWLRRFVRIGAPAAGTLAVIAALRQIHEGAGASWTDLAAAAGFFADFYWADCATSADPCPYPLIASHFWSLSLEGQFYVLAPALVALPRRLALPLFLIALAIGAAVARPVGSSLWTTRPDALFIGMAVAMLRERGLRSGKLWPSLSLGQAVYWACLASILERLAIGRLSGLGLTFIAIAFGLILAGRLDADPDKSWLARTLRKCGAVSFAAYLTHLPVMSGVHAALAQITPPALSLLLSLAAMAAIAPLWDALIVNPSAHLGRRLSRQWILINCKHRLGLRNLNHHFIRCRRTKWE